VNTELESLPDDSTAVPDDTAEVSGYTSVSALSIAGLLLGLASPVCGMGTLLKAIPLAGVGVSLVALRRIATSEGALVGRPAAIVGLILSISSGTAVVSFEIVTRQLRIDQAAEVGRQWIADVLSGNTERAYFLASGGPVPLEEEEFGPGGNPYHRFLNGPTLKGLTSAGKDAKVQYVETVQYSAQGRGEFYVRQRFVVTPEDAAAAGQVTPVNVVLQLHRRKAPGASYMTWLATPIDDDDPPTG
jgi:hypothetical protein